MRTVFRCLLASLLIAAASACNAAPKEAYTLQYQFVPGTTWHYTETIDVNQIYLAPGATSRDAKQQHRIMELTETVLSVRPSDGAANLQIGIGPFIKNQAKAKNVRVEHFQVLLSKDGRVLWATIPESSIAEESDLPTTLPVHPASISGVWHSPIEMDEFDVPMQQEYKLNGISQSSDGSKLAKIQSKGKGTVHSAAHYRELPRFGTAEISRTGTCDFNLTQGVMQDSTEVANITLYGPQTMGSSNLSMIAQYTTSTAVTLTTVTHGKVSAK